MHGVVFDVLERVVTESSGEDGWDDVLEGAGSDGVYTRSGWYAEEELRALLSQIRPQASAADRLRWFAYEAADILPDRFPEWLTGCGSTADVLRILPELLLSELQALHPRAGLPQLEVLQDAAAPRHVALAFAWDGDWCAMVEGLIHGFAAHFGERARVVHAKCVSAGAASCLLVCELSGPCPHEPCPGDPSGQAASGVGHG